MDINININVGEEPEVEIDDKKQKVKIKKRKLKNGVENILELPNQTEIEGTPGNNAILNMMGM